MDNYRENESATDDGRPIDPTTGEPVKQDPDGMPAAPVQESPRTPSETEWALTADDPTFE